VSRGRYILPAAVRRLEEGSPHFQLCWPRNREIKGEFPPRSAHLRRNFIQVNVLAVSKTSMGDEQATIRIKTRLSEQVKTVATDPSDWLWLELHSLLMATIPMRMHLMVRDVQEEYSYNDWVKSNKAVYDIFVKNNIPTKRRRVEGDEHDDEESDDNRDDTVINFNFQHWNRPIWRFCHLLFTA